MHVWLVGYCLSEDEDYIFEITHNNRSRCGKFLSYNWYFSAMIINVTNIILYRKTLYHIILTAHCPNIALVLATLSHDF